MTPPTTTSAVTIPVAQVGQYAGTLTRPQRQRLEALTEAARIMRLKPSPLASAAAPPRDLVRVANWVLNGFAPGRWEV